MSASIYICVNDSSDAPVACLSEHFCNLMAVGEYIFNQVANKTGIDISALYEMSNYGCDLRGMSEDLIDEMAETEKEKKKLLKADKAANKKCEGNIERVSLTIDNLIQKYTLIKTYRKDLDTIIDDEDFFEGEDFFEITFLEDLQALQSFLSFHKNKGTKTVFFCYG